MKFKITNVRRFLISLSIALLVISKLSIANLSLLETTGYSVYYKSVMVESGDTLSSIALKYNYTNKNIDRYVDEIKQFNGLKSNYIYAGEEIIVPVLTYNTSVAQK